MRKVYLLSLLLLALTQLSAQYLYETQLTGTASRMSLIKAPGDSLKAILTTGGTGGNVAFYHINPRGEIAESYRVGSSLSSDFGNDIVATQDGNYAFIGHTNASPINGADWYFGKMTPGGALLWQYTAGNISTDFGRTILQTQDGGLLVGGMSQFPTAPSVYRSYLIKANQGGEILWEKTFKNNTGSQEILDMVEFPSGTVAAVGYYSGPLSLGIDGLLYLLNPDGSLLANIGIGGPGNDVIEAVMLSPEGTLIVAGHTMVITV